MRCSPHRCCCCHQSKVNIRAGKFPPAEANGVLLPQGAGEARVIRRDDWAGLACRWRILPATAIDARCPDMALRVISLPRINLVFSERSGHRTTLTEHDLGMLEFWDDRRRRRSKPV